MWYRSGLIVDSCEKVLLPDKREILLCEDEDSQMGHKLHYLYAVDLKTPLSLNRSLLAKTDSFEDVCVSQEQSLTGFRWNSDRQELSLAVATPEWIRVSTEPYCSGYPKRPSAMVHLKFSVKPEGLRRVLAEPAARK